MVSWGARATEGARCRGGRAVRGARTASCAATLELCRATGKRARASAWPRHRQSELELRC